MKKILILSNIQQLRPMKCILLLINFSFHATQKTKRQKKRFCAKISQNPFVYCFLLPLCHASPRALRFGACVAPKVFSFFFDSKKEHHKNIFGTLCCTCFCACSKMTMYRAIPQTTHPLLPQGIEVIFISQKKIA